MKIFFGLILLGITMENYRYANLISIADISYFILAIIGLKEIINKKKVSLDKSLSFCLLLSIVIGLISILYNSNNLVTFIGSICRLIFLIGCSIIISNGLQDEKLKLSIISGVKIALSIHISLLIFQWLRWSINQEMIIYNLPMFQNEGNLTQLFGHGKFRATGLAAEPAHIANILILYTWIIYIYSKNIHNLHVIIVTLMIVLIKSMGGIMLWILTLLCMYYKTIIKSGLLKKIGLILCSIIIGTVSFDFINELVISRFNSFIGGGDGSITIRLLGSLEGMLIGLRESRGIGIGIGNLDNLFYENIGDFIYLTRPLTFNILFYWIMSNGILGGISYIYMIFYNYKKRNVKAKALSWFMIAYSFSTGTFLVPICMLILVMGGKCFEDKYNYSDI
ncbi:MAG: hypothetical protein E6590_06730 [Clostridiales bacterium]|nr:hypothetical protein [Clostridiales bacterium]